MSEDAVAPSLTSPPVLHVLVVGFHHKKGCQVEYATPPLIGGQDCYSSELPAQWKHLPSLALPDGSHNFDSDTCFFHLPDLENPRKTVFGISCYRQTDASRLANKPSDITRTTVQKSVCVLSRLPLYGHIQVKMSLITEAYFREGDLSRLDLIDETLHNLNACLSDTMLRTQQLYVGLDSRSFVQRLKQRSLTLFKLLLLERKVLLYQSPVVDLSTFLLTLLSLHPGMLENGLNEASCVVPADTPPDATTPEPVDDVVIEDDVKPEDLIGQIPLESVGLPLKVFTGGNLCHPYVSLQYLDMLTQPSVHGYMVGATNVLFVQKKGLAEVVIDIERDRLDVVQNPELKKALQLTTEDLRFTDNLVKQTGGTLNDAVGRWEGGDEWVRAQFRFYLVSLLRTCLEDEEAASGSFNPAFVQMWRGTRNFQCWRRRFRKGGILLRRVEPGHPFAATATATVVTDVKLHISNTIHNSEGGKRVTQAVASTGRAVVGGISSAKGALSSWITSLKSLPPDDKPSLAPSGDTTEQQREVSSSSSMTVGQDGGQS